MAKRAAATHLPTISLGRSDHLRLSRLADTLSEKDPQAADQLADELDRATVLDDDVLPRGTVRMGSTVTFALEGDAPQTVSLVFPGHADIAAGRLSVLTPVGAALIGLSAGQSIVWPNRGGRPRQLRVIAVSNG